MASSIFKAKSKADSSNHDFALSRSRNTRASISGFEQRTIDVPDDEDDADGDSNSAVLPSSLLVALNRDPTPSNQALAAARLSMSDQQRPKFSDSPKLRRAVGGGASAPDSRKLPAIQPISPLMKGSPWSSSSRQSTPVSQNKSSPTMGPTSNVKSSSQSLQHALATPRHITDDTPVLPLGLASVTTSPIKTPAQPNPAAFPLGLDDEIRQADIDQMAAQDDRQRTMTGRKGRFPSISLQEGGPLQRQNSTDSTEVDVEELEDDELLWMPQQTFVHDLSQRVRIRPGTAGSARRLVPSAGYETEYDGSDMDSEVEDDLEENKAPTSSPVVAHNDTSNQRTRLEIKRTKPSHLANVRVPLNATYVSPSIQTAPMTRDGSAPQSSLAKDPYSTFEASLGSRGRSQSDSILPRAASQERTTESGDQRDFSKVLGIKDAAALHKSQSLGMRTKSVRWLTCLR